jgi:hypothetical protein
MKRIDKLCKEFDEMIEEYKDIPKRSFARSLELVRSRDYWKNAMKKQVSKREFDRLVNKECNSEFKDNPVPGHQAMAIVRDIIASIKRKFTIYGNK